jgi:hypothetical protein
MWSLASLDNLSTDDKYKYFGRPMKIPIRVEEWRAGEIVKPMDVTSRFLGDKVFLADFGIAMKAGTSVSRRGRAL